jgi:hypothetical protein
MSTEKLLGQTSEKRTLRYDFTAVEIHDLSMQLANKTKDVASLVKKKKSVTSQCTAEINAAESACAVLSNQVADGYEHRDVECEVIFNQPANGKKTIIRKDSNTLVGVEAMTTNDWNLINEENNLFGGDPLKQEEPQLADEETEEGE